MSDSYDDYEARMQLAESVREARLSTLNQQNKADTFYLNREEIIRMAREADIDPYDMCEDPRIAENNLERFAALVAAAEREACAKLCEDDGMLWGARYAAKIRARGRND